MLTLALFPGLRRFWLHEERVLQATKSWSGPGNEAMLTYAWHHKYSTSWQCHWVHSHLCLMVQLWATLVGCHRCQWTCALH